jgi:hypothetical protein
MGCDFLMGKSGGLKKGQIAAGWYELPVLDQKKTGKGQNNKS